MSTAPSRSRSLIIVAVILTVVILLSLAACGGSFAWLLFRASQAKADMDSEVDALLASVHSDDPAEFYRERSTPEFRRSSSEDDFVRFAKLLKSRLGKLRSKSVRSFNAHQFNTTSSVTLVYDAQFEHDKAEMTFTWQRTGAEPWRVHAFRVNSLALLEGTTRECPHCQARAPEDARFCPNCGLTMEPPTESPPTDSSESAPEVLEPAGDEPAGEEPAESTPDSAP